MNKPVKSLTAREKVRQALYRCSLMHLPVPEPTPYFMTILDKPAFVWFRVAKVATRTIITHLEQHHLAIRDTQGPARLYAPLLYKNHFKFAFVRNPWSRLVSCWRAKVVQQGVFKQSEAVSDRFDLFVEQIERENLEICNKHYRLQCKLIDLNRLDFLGRLERFPEDFRHVCQTLAIPAGTIPWKNASRQKTDYRACYTDGLAERVGRLYRRDIDLFGYTFDPPGKQAP